MRHVGMLAERKERGDCSAETERGLSLAHGGGLKSVWPCDLNNAHRYSTVQILMSER